MFNPNNNKKEKQHVYGTYIPTRRPAWKTYSNIGHAKSSLAHFADYPEEKDNRLPDHADRYNYRVIPDKCTMWKLVDGEWKGLNIERFYDRRKGVTVNE